MLRSLKQNAASASEISRGHGAGPSGGGRSPVLRATRDASGRHGFQTQFLDALSTDLCGRPQTAGSEQKL